MQKLHIKCGNSNGKLFKNFFYLLIAMRNQLMYSLKIFRLYICPGERHKYGCNIFCANVSAEFEIIRQSAVFIQIFRFNQIVRHRNKRLYFSLTRTQSKLLVLPQSLITLYSGEYCRVNKSKVF